MEQSYMELSRFALTRRSGSFYRQWLAALAVGGMLTGCGDVTEPVATTIPVQLTTAELDSGIAAVTLSGTIVPRVESQLAFRVPGRVVSRPVDAGMTINKGDVLARLDEEPFRLAREEADAAFAQAQSTMARLRRDVERNRQLAKTGAVAGADFDAIESAYAHAQAETKAAQSRVSQARNNLSYAQLTAPAGGTVALVQAEVGQVVAAGTPVIRLAYAGENEVQVDVPERYVAQLSPGHTVTVTLLSLPDSNLNGSVREVATVADPATRTYRVRISLPHLPPKARLGMTATAMFQDNGASGQILLPIGALFQQEGKQAVWVLPEGKQQLVLKPVSIGAMGTEWFAVATGVKLGDRVVTAGVHRLDEGLSVRPWDGRLP
ncbi:efflux RND transporter periplasmic adaptor subunit [Pseudomonas chlororaphis]|uniref:efflux RND transporter periplasmic adaptor subunit n=1 Tax=Pseudomonas chlororaphis TaxID=587753 RepID=UPI0012D332CB|nr:efflux RND transporter periplasmic adaptor subunit [Pseudomonas chlororaphis]